MENYNLVSDMSQKINWTIIVTCWWGFIDIDGFACAIAYAELLRFEWKDAVAVLTDTLNASITPEIRAIGAKFSPNPQMGDSFVIVDMSDPEKIQEFAPLDRISEIYDHHFGFEEYWDSILGERAKIEPIGAAATLIWEEFKIRGFAKEISPESATLLAHAIISNTVNFLVGLSTERDKTSLSEIIKIAGLQEDWIARYFHSQQKYIEQNPEEAIINDTKFLLFPEFWRVAFWQLEIWDSTEFIETVPIDGILTMKDTDAWIFKCIDIQNGETQIYSNHPWIIERLKKAFHWISKWNVVYIKKVILRKEIHPILKTE